VLFTNRALYSNDLTEAEDNIKIPRDLHPIFSKFSGYSYENTLLLTTYPNTLTEFAKNDLIINPFNVKYPGFENDVGCYALMKYLRGIKVRMN
jgi:hypothetical protein